MTHATKRPWRVDLNRYDGEYRVYQGGDDPRPITNSMFKGKDAKEDCERIVRAVNSYDALVEALKAVRQVWNAPRYPVIVQGVLEQVDNALAKARDGR